jgi:hypothetical protein
MAQLLSIYYVNSTAFGLLNVNNAMNYISKFYLHYLTKS